MNARILGTLIVHFWRVMMHTVSSSPILRAVLGSLTIGAVGHLVFNATAHAQTSPRAEIRVVVSSPLAVTTSATCHPEKVLRKYSDRCANGFNPTTCDEHLVIKFARLST
jgi:hypothetical protein